MWKASKELKIYSVIMRQGPDILHYDLVYKRNEGKLYFIFLGEHAENIRPRLSLPKQHDLYLYKILKKRRRTVSTSSLVYDLVIEVCEISNIKIYKGSVNRDRQQVMVLELHLDNQRTQKKLVLEISPKIKPLIKQLMKSIKRDQELVCTKKTEKP